MRIVRQKSLISVLMLVFLFGMTPARGQKSAEEFPVVESAAAPFYPRVANLSRIQGEVRVRVATDGLKVVSYENESGPPMLVQAAKENIHTWLFRRHKPTKFEITFRYRFDEEFSCTVGNSSVILHMPSEVQISARGVHTCDESDIRHDHL